MHRVLLICGDKPLAAQVKQALDSTSTVMSADPAIDNVQDVAGQFRPEMVLVDSDIRLGARTAFERLSIVREWFPDLPMVVIGNESGAHLILTAMRAGAQDFLDRDAADEDVRNVVARHIASGRPRGGSSHIVSVLSAGSCEEDGDFAVNLGVSVAAARPREGILLVDLALPASNTAISLGLELSFRVKEAVKEMSRLDRALLDSALARCPRSGLYVLPLAVHGDAEDWLVSVQDLRALLEICQALYDVVIVSYGPFSRQEELVGLPGDGALFFLPCNQRFTSIKGAAEMLRFVRQLRSDNGEPVLVVHEFAPGMAPDATGIKSAVGARQAIELPVRWHQLAESVNRGEPLGLDSSTPYAQSLSRHLANLSLLPQQAVDDERRQPIKAWARKLLGVLP
ncbi:response regulator receiver protein [Parvibaculum lavamentivorans DS-1]|uniref:Response regulator receiver protein n=1 Tax=Parvibaculum lavamentivorans (strain DS-1 / DSM 13023 / NCIMB 13966) TaxID=402881 RepID=A7HP61_PARL1|nr:response regulator [Parvibaculum lavamentivorans]ABS61694.1 response regulator receiver protein [Parvibaculum lavamentivorans DS-1]